MKQLGTSDNTFPSLNQVMLTEVLLKNAKVKSEQWWSWIGLDWIYREGSETNPNRFCLARESKDLTTAQKSHEHYSLPLYSNRTTCVNCS